MKSHYCSAWEQILEIEEQTKRPVIETASNNELSDDDSWSYHGDRFGDAMDSHRSTDDEKREVMFQDANLHD